MLLLEESPGLHREIPVRLARHYPLARRDAARETRLPLATFPGSVPLDGRTDRRMRTSGRKDKRRDRASAQACRCGEALG